MFIYSEIDICVKYSQSSTLLVLAFYGDSTHSKQLSTQSFVAKLMCFYVLKVNVLRFMDNVIFVIELLYLLHLNLSFRSFGGGNYAMQGSEMATMGMEIPGQPMNKKSKAVGETR